MFSSVLRHLALTPFSTRDFCAHGSVLFEGRGKERVSTRTYKNNFVPCIVVDTEEVTKQYSYIKKLLYFSDFHVKLLRSYVYFP